ncbi:hypothetical protein NA56DRAFT_697118 [Hyaloscypha hepaticicola]|uniref:Carotenoid oxygenase n=1 Tax=Hyaloscypha hepaticicola TaxID=2082293 RepID=A0A2J6QL16_9HELO|nr:hypothetical protein NA56DRAFT_697118 [Hyaloscypha hepaticicola]
MKNELQSNLKSKALYLLLQLEPYSEQAWLGVREIEGENGKLFRVNHWFDNLARIHRFQIHTPQEPDQSIRATYNSKSICDGLIAKLGTTGNRDGVTFGAKYDPCMSLFQKNRYNYNLGFVKGQGVYRVFLASASTGDTSILATISDDPAYVHSMLLTENYAILCVWNSLYAYGGAPILWTKNIVDALAEFDPNRPDKWYVINKRPVEEGGRGLVAKFESNPFFCFHLANAFEEFDDDGRLNIIAGVVAYEDLDILKHVEAQMNIVFANLANDNHEVFETTWDFIASKNYNPELPTINPSMSLKKHRFVYVVLHTGISTLFDSIVKYDVSSQTAKTWSQNGHTPVEPVFVADPASQVDDEDAGVLLSVLLDGIKGMSYLLILDAKTLVEVGKAHVNGVIGFSFHGTHVPS